MIWNRYIHKFSVTHTVSLFTIHETNKGTLNSPSLQKQKPGFFTLISILKFSFLPLLMQHICLFYFLKKCYHIQHPNRMLLQILESLLVFFEQGIYFLFCSSVISSTCQYIHNYKIQTRNIYYCSLHLFYEDVIVEIEVVCANFDEYYHS